MREKNLGKAVKLLATEADPITVDVIRQEGTKMKAHEFLKQTQVETLQKIADFKEELRKKKLVEHFESCARCGGKISYFHRTNWDFMRVREDGHCDSCYGPLEPREYPLQ